MYNIIFIILLLLTFFEKFIKLDKKITFMIFLMLLCFLIFRYGQGSDYFHYVYLIGALANDFERALINSDVWKIPNEIGFTYISYFWIKILHLSPELLIAIFSGLSFIIIYKFIVKYSDRPILSLFIFYCVFYLIYPFSAIRQAFCLSVFVFYMTPMLFERKYLKYYCLSLLLLTIHYSSVVLFIIPLVNIVKSFKIRDAFIVSIICLIIGVIFIFYLNILFSVFGAIGAKIKIYSNTSIDLVSLLLRIALFILIINTNNYYDKDSIKNLFLRIYIFGFLIYLMFFSSSLIASRLNVFMRYFEIILLTDYFLFMVNKKKLPSLHFSFIILIVSVIYFKNINSFIGQGPYMSGIKVYNYPYVSVFNKKKILKVRQFEPSYLQYVKR
jgi:hypothetical protein